MRTPSLVEKTLHAATHPVSTAAYAVGLVRGTAVAVLRAASGSGGPAKAEWSPPPEPLPDEAVQTPESEIVRHLAAAPDPAPQREPEPPAESFVTEPSAATRASAHEGIRHGGAGDDAAIDDWYDDEDDVAGSVVEALERGDKGAAIDEGELKAILSESETLRKAAETDKG